MTNKTLKNFLNDKDWHHGFFNAGMVYCLTTLGVMIANQKLDLNLNAYHSIEHLSIGVGIGSMTYRKAGGGLKGLVGALKWGTAFNLGWESLVYLGGVSETLINRTSDILMVYGGNLLTPLIERYKDKN
jgi:hypothetical protein